MGWWLDPGFIAFDTETTGVDPHVDHIVTAAAVTFVQGEPIGVQSWLIRLEIPIPPASTAVHGITDEMSQSSGMDERLALTQIRDCLASGLPVVAFNSLFDMAMLNGNLRRLGEGELTTDRAICPMVIDKQFNKYVRGSNQRRLAPTAGRYGLEFSDEDWHGAEPDAVMAGRILLSEMQAYPTLGSYPVEELLTQVNEWRAQQEAEFQAWLATRPPR